MDDTNISGDNCTVYAGSPRECDLCERAISFRFYDAKTSLGPWANMCPTCFKVAGVGLGTGLGQLYERQTEGRYCKIAG